MEQRVIKFKRYFKHYKTDEILYKEWGCLSMDGDVVTDFSSFTSPSFISGYKPFADCQFTGLKDNEGVEIFEGDICQSLVKGVIEYRDGSFCLVNKDNAWLLSDFALRRKLDDLEVIGSIYTHPQLLEK